MLRTLTIVFASTTGNTEYVVDVLMRALEQHKKELRVSKVRAEIADPESLLKGDVLLLASGSWNTNDIEGQLNPQMFDLLCKRCIEINFQSKPTIIIGLGDDRYHFTARAAEKLAEFVKDHGGQLLLSPYKLLNDPYGQEEKITLFAEELWKQIKALPISHTSIE